MIKNPDKKIFMPLHADWTYVDENQYRSMSVWVPLVDTDENNGSLGVIAGSHRVMNKIRGPRIRQSSYDHDKLWTQKYGKLLPAKAGTAVIYDHALMHFSPPNYSSIPRPAINLSLVPDEAQAIHYCIPEGAHDIEKYEVNDKSFYMEYDNFQRPRRQKPIEHLPVDSVKWIDEKMNNFIVPVIKKKTIWSHFWGV
jgi:ectoine hydroxylase-related dioxygenase (phytanoyl-CoA dioxygenase family)